MRDLIQDLQLVVPSNKPEPDPLAHMATWISWFRDLTHCDLQLALGAVKRRRAEWEAMNAATTP